jgi:hypothetical protein
MCDSVFKMEAINGEQQYLHKCAATDGLNGRRARGWCYVVLQARAAAPRACCKGGGRGGGMEFPVDHHAAIKKQLALHVR